MRAVALETFGGDETLRAAREGDHAAFASLVEEHEAMVFFIALRFFGDRSRAEEIAQDVFVQLYRSLDEITSAAHLLFWLRQATTFAGHDAEGYARHGRQSSRGSESSSGVVSSDLAEIASLLETS